MIRALALVLATSGAALAQGIAFGGLAQDTGEPVEVEAEALDVDQADGSAVFSGGVTVAQGAMRLRAATVEIEYAEAGDAIERLRATGGVTIVAGEEAAEADEAIYAVAQGTVTLTGDVILTQGRNALSGDRLVIDLASGTGRLEGRVRTILQGEGR